MGQLLVWIVGIIIVLFLLSFLFKRKTIGLIFIVMGVFCLTSVAILGVGLIIVGIIQLIFVKR